MIFLVLLWNHQLYLFERNTSFIHHICMQLVCFQIIYPIIPFTWLFHLFLMHTLYVLWCVHQTNQSSCCFNSVSALCNKTSHFVAVSVICEVLRSCNWRWLTHTRGQVVICLKVRCGFKENSYWAKRDSAASSRLSPRNSVFKRAPCF